MPPSNWTTRLLVIKSQPRILHLDAPNLFVTNIFLMIESFAIVVIDAPQILPTIIVGTIIIVFGLPFFSVANVSLFSKLTDERTQG